MNHDHVPVLTYCRGGFHGLPVGRPVLAPKSQPLHDRSGTGGTGRNLSDRPLTGIENWIAGPSGTRPHETFARLSDAGQRVYLKETQREWNEYLYWKIVVLPKLERWVKTVTWLKDSEKE